MPNEFRRLTFGLDELPAALKDRGDANIEALSKGNVVSVASKSIGGGFVYALTVIESGGGRVTTLDLPETEVREGLLSYCVGHRIPIPRAALKTVRLVDGKLCVDMLIGAAETVGEPPGG